MPHIKCVFILFFALHFSMPVQANEGTIKQISGDLAYVTGLNGSAPLWSHLVVQNGQQEGAKLEVIKELPDLVVARVVDANGTGVKPGDKIVVQNSPPVNTTRKALRTVHATRVDTSPNLDGDLSDAVWAQATPIEGFVERVPNYWMPSAEQTVARIIYTNTSIYFAFECFAQPASKFVANNMRRDAVLSGDDNIQIMLDTYNDRQNGFFFFVNPLGAKTDLLLSNSGRTYNYDWDCNWTARSKQYPDRWTAEIEIPFSQLRFKEGEEIIWGINLSRNNAKTNLESQLVVGRQSASITERYLMTELGELRGLTNLRTKRPIQLKPYMLPGTTKDFQVANSGENTSFETGVDLRYGITSNITLDLSYNTDFAQVEGDQEQTNLTQFRLFFPEKREFFLEGANLFQFGEQAQRSGSGTRPPTLLFYSRRIGLESGRKIPILFGSKIAGKEGRTSIGALNVLTDEQSFGNTQINRTNYSVLRMSRDFSDRSNFGFIMVNKQINDPNGGWNQYNRAGGIDINYAPTQNLNFQAFVARTWDSQIGDSDDARFAMMNYRGTKYWARFKFADIEDQFEPAVGFVNRRSGLQGFRRYELYTRYRPKPGVLNIRYLSLGPELEVFTDRNNNIVYRVFESSNFAIFNTGEMFGVKLFQTYDVVEKAFSPSARHKNVSIPPGTYESTTFSINPRSSRSRKFAPEITFEAGEYYTGTRYTIETETAFRPSGRLSYELEYEGNWLRLPNGNLSIHTLSNRLLYSFSTDFFVKLFVQWNNDREFASSNLLLNYRYRPGSDIFIVFDNAYDTTLGDLKQRNRSVLVKMSYLLNL